MKPSPETTQKIAFTALWVVASIVILLFISIIGYISIKGLPSLSWHFVFGPTTEGGLSAPIVGTLYIIALTLLFTIPLGVGTALYLSEYAEQNKFIGFIRYALDSLAGIPSIIYGLFGVALFVVIIFKKANILAGSLTLTCLTLPFMVGAAEEAMRAIPKEWREASLSLGATKWQTIWNIVLPQAQAGIVTGTILCMGRVVAETAPLLATAGFGAFIPKSPFDGCRTLALHLFYLSTEAPSVGGITRNDLLSQAMGVALILVVITIILNFLVRLFSEKYIKRTGGESKI